MLRNLPPLKHSIFIGGHKHGTDWIWKETMEKIDYHMFWTTGQPDNAGSIENCLCFRSAVGFGSGFNDGHCGTEHGSYGYSCQKVGN